MTACKKYGGGKKFDTGWMTGLAEVSQQGMPEDEAEEIDGTRLCWTWRSYERAWNWLQEQREASEIWKWAKWWRLYLTDIFKSHIAAGWRTGWRMAYLVPGSLPRTREARCGGPSGSRSCVHVAALQCVAETLRGCPLRRAGLASLQESPLTPWIRTVQREQTEVDELLYTCPIHLQKFPASLGHHLHLNNFCSHFL